VSKKANKRAVVQEIVEKWNPEKLEASNLGLYDSAINDVAENFDPILSNNDKLGNLIRDVFDSYYGLGNYSYEDCIRIASEILQEYRKRYN